MTSDNVSFELMVERSWSLAVFEAAYRFEELKPTVLAALSSPNGEVRSAAVAVLNEANDQTAHDQVVALIRDQDQWVRHEVLEYLNDFAVEEDAELILGFLKEREHLFLASRALERLYPQGPLIDEEADVVSQEADISMWEAIIGSR